MKENRLKIAIIGSGNIGTDLLVKITKSKDLVCTLFVGRNLNSPGMKKAIELGINVSDLGIEALKQNPEIYDVVIDATSAQSHIEHWKILKDLKKPVIDMTPAKIGDFCIPAIEMNKKELINSYNINLVTCGGQTSIPIAYALSQVHSDIDYIEVASNIASLSAGPATRLNLDEYVETTEKGIKMFSGAKKSKAILILNPAEPPIDMQTTVYAKIKNPDLKKITESVNRAVEEIKKYVPGYQLVVPPTIQDNRVFITVKVLGAGDYLPSYAGNLDIINCAALKILELIAENKTNDKENNNQ
jgi:acetaldehyde dehydrogenase (acetylating)